MAEVVQQSLQYLTTADVTAMAVYLKALPEEKAEPAEMPTGPRVDQVIAQGKDPPPTVPPATRHCLFTFGGAFCVWKKCD